MRENILEQIMEVRETGSVSMFDLLGVQKIANELGCSALFDFIEEHSNEYFKLILSGN